MRALISWLSENLSVPAIRALLIPLPFAGEVATYAYSTWANPKFAIKGQKVDAATWALVGFAGAPFLGIVVVPNMQALRQRIEVNG